MYRGQEEWFGLILALLLLKKALPIHYFGGGIGSKGSNQTICETKNRTESGWCWRLMVTLYHMIIAIRYHTAIPKFSSRSMVTLSFHSIESSLETWRVYTTEKIQVVSEYSKKTFQQTSTNHWRFLPRFCMKTKIRVNDQVTQIQHTTHSPQRASRQEKVALLSENPHLGWHKQNCGTTRNSWK